LRRQAVVGDRLLDPDHDAGDVAPLDRVGAALQRCNLFLDLTQCLCHVLTSALF
jgi:hypothetical protein